MRVQRVTDVTDGFGWACLGCAAEWFAQPASHDCPGEHPYVRPFIDSPDGREQLSEWRAGWPENGS